MDGIGENNPMENSGIPSMARVGLREKNLKHGGAEETEEGRSQPQPLPHRPRVGGYMNCRYWRPRISIPWVAGLRQAGDRRSSRVHRHYHSCFPLFPLRLRVSNSSHPERKPTIDPRTIPTAIDRRAQGRIHRDKPGGATRGVSASLRFSSRCGNANCRRQRIPSKTPPASRSRWRRLLRPQPTGSGRRRIPSAPSRGG